MRGHARTAACAVLALASALACGITRPASTDPNLVSVAVLLKTGEREARIFGIHADTSSVPAIVASVEGPGWMAPFSDSLPPEACFPVLYSREDVACLAAKLPEVILPGVEYRLSGESRHGPFTGAMTMPSAPVLLEPDTLRFRAEDIWTDAGIVGVPVSYRFGSEVGMMIGEIGGSSRRLEDADSGVIEWDPDTLVRSSVPVAVPMRLAGLGRNYVRFLEAAGDRSEDDFLVREPWPETGIHGDGVYGYFDGVSFSRTVTVVVEFPDVE